jgi:putative copper export protein
MYLAALLVIGSCAFILIIVPRVTHLSGGDRALSTVVPSARRVARWAAVVLIFATLARLLAQGYMLGEGQSLIIGSLLASTVWGWGWLVGAVATIVIAYALFVARAGTAAWRVTAAGTLGVALSFALTGHATSTHTSPALHVIADAIHVMAAGGWLGTLLVVATIGLRTVFTLPIEKRARAAAELIGAFSNFALFCVATLVITGVVAAWSQLPTLSALWQTPYGLALTRKLVVIALTGFVGIFNWRFVQPRLNDPATISLLRKSAAAELTIGLAVVILTAVLVGTSPPDSDDATSTSLRPAPVSVAAAPAHP